MFRNKALSCMLALGLTISAAPAVLAGPNDTAGNSTAVDKTENPEDAPVTPPGEQSSGTSPEGDGQAKPEGTTPEGEGATTPEGEGTTTPEGEGATEGELTTPGEGTTTEDGTTTPEGTTDGTTTPDTGTTTPDSTTSEGSTSLPQTGAPVALLAPVLLVGGAAGYSIYKKSH